MKKELIWVAAVVVILGVMFSQSTFVHRPNKNVTAGNSARTESVAAVAYFADIEALEKALDEYKGDGVLSDVSLEKENGKLIYSVEFIEGNRKIDVRINAQTGDIEDVVRTEGADMGVPTDVELEKMVNLLDKFINSFRARVGSASQ